MITELQRQQIISMRQRGATYVEIGAAVGMPSGTVKTYCWRRGIVPIGPKEKARSIPPERCLNCGKRLQQEPKKKPRKFCCVRCCETWWNNNRMSFESKSRCHIFCAYCGTEFEKYKNSAKRYCSHQCYINNRYGEVKINAAE